MDFLPDELFALIVSNDIDIYRNLIKAYPRFGLLTTVDNDHWKEMFTERHVTDECVEWFLAGKRHREKDLAAVIWYSGRQEWWCRGMRHRECDRPAITNKHGLELWYWQGELHRENDQPALIWNKSKHREWWIRNQRHREGGLPAIVWDNGDKEWWWKGTFRDRFIL